mgnify:CR=1 FL=1
MEKFHQFLRLVGESEDKVISTIKSLTNVKIEASDEEIESWCSRWENGNTMPELGILVELAEFYEVDIKEVIDGERKSETMEKETRETLKKVADYAEIEKKLVVRRKCIVTFVGTAMFALCIVLGSVLFPKLPADSFLRSDGLWLGIGILGVTALWGIVINENRKNAKKSEER